MTTEERDLMNVREQAVGSPGRRALGVRTRFPTVDVVICACTVEREAPLRRTTASVVEQEHAARSIVVIDYGPDLVNARSSGPGLGDGVEPHENVYERRLFGARNTGLGLATADIVTFLDDDACAHPTWMESLRQADTDQKIVGTDGWVTPEWEGAPPGWFPDECLWIVGCSYRGLPTGPMAEIRNPIGANMSTVRSHLTAAGGFLTGLGRIGTTPLGREETGAAIRVRASAQPAKIVHLDGARVDHSVPRSRATWSCSCNRCRAGGPSKAIVTGAAGRAGGLCSGRPYVPRNLPTGILYGVGDTCRGDAPELVRSGAIVAGRALTARGYLSVRPGPLKSSQDGASQPVRAVRMGPLRVCRCIPIRLADGIGTGASARWRGAVRRRRKIGVK